jgi:hypothetical protein
VKPKYRPNASIDDGAEGHRADPDDAGGRSGLGVGVTSHCDEGEDADRHHGGRQSPVTQLFR